MQSRAAAVALAPKMWARQKRKRKSDVTLPCSFLSGCLPAWLEREEEEGKTNLVGIVVQIESGAEAKESKESSGLSGGGALEQAEEQQQRQINKANRRRRRRRSLSILRPQNAPQRSEPPLCILPFPWCIIG